MIQELQQTKQSKFISFFDVSRLVYSKRIANSKIDEKKIFEIGKDDNFKIAINRKNTEH